jgi:hypothetical protein
MTYTVYNDAEVDLRVDRDLALIVDAVQDELPETAAVVLVGAFGRGEGGVLFEGGGCRPVNDYDIVLAVRSPCSQDRLVALAGRLAREIGIRHVDLIAIPLAEFGTLPPSQFNYDMRHGGRVLWGEDVLSAMPIIEARALPVTTAWRLMVNRAVCLLEGYAGTGGSAPAGFEETFLALNQTTKAVLGCGEARLIHAGRYEHTYAGRREGVRALCGDRPKFVKLHDLAVERKLRPDLRAAVDACAFWRDALAEYVATLSAIVLDSWQMPATLESCSRVIALLRDRVSLDSIEEAELRLILGRHCRGWRTWVLVAQAAALLQRNRLAIAKWARLRDAAVAAWHRSHP